MHRPDRYRVFLSLMTAVAVSIVMSNPLLGAPSSKAPRKAAAVDITASAGSGTIVSGPGRATDSPLVRAAHFANVARARYAAEGKESVAMNRDRVVSLGAVGLVPLPVVSEPVPRAARAAAVPAPPRPPGAISVAPTSNVSSSVSMTTIGSSITTSSPGSSVSTSTVPSTVGIFAPSSAPTSSVSGSVSTSPIVP